MWVIPENLINSTNITITDPTTDVDIEDTNFPVANMVDKYPKKKSKATQEIAKITATNISWCGGVAIINVGCPTITNLTVKDADGNVVYSNPSIPLITAGSYYNWFNSQITYKDRFIHLFDQAYPNASIEFTLNYLTGTNAYIGLLMSGLVYKIGDAEWGLSDNPEDYSLIKTTLNGSPIIIKRDILRNKNYKIFSIKEEYERFFSLAQEYRDNFWLFVPAKDIVYEETYIRYGLLKELPKVPQNRYQYINYTIDIIEVT